MLIEEGLGQVSLTIPGRRIESKRARYATTLCLLQSDRSWQTNETAKEALVSIHLPLLNYTVAL